MKKTAITFVLSLLFMFLSSFTGDSRVSSEHEINLDSTTIVQVQFDNPRILIDDYRSYKVWAELLHSNEEKDSALIGMIGAIVNNFDTFVKSQERRYESGMDYLIRKTGLSIDEINNATKTRNKTIKNELIIYAILVLLSFWFAFMNRLSKKGGYVRQLVRLSVFISLSTIMMYLTDRLLLMTVNSDFYNIIQLLKLSG